MTTRVYHVTYKEDWGDSIVLFPRIPLSAAKGEPEIDRICVAPSIEQAIFAAGEIDFVRAIYFADVEDEDLFGAWNVFDSHITEELWLFKPTKFELLTRVTSKNRMNVPFIRPEKLDIKDLQKIRLWLDSWLDYRVVEFIFEQEEVAV